MTNDSGRSPIGLFLDFWRAASILRFGSLPFRFDPPALRGSGSFDRPSWFGCRCHGFEQAFEFVETVVDILELISIPLTAENQFPFKVHSPAIARDKSLTNITR